MKVVLEKFKNYKKVSFFMIKVGEHITRFFLGVKIDYSPEFYEKIIYKIAKAKKWKYLTLHLINFNRKVLL